jgi:hypothetical protein
MRRLAALRILFLVLVACTGTGQPSSGEGGIRGTVLLGPTCPVQTQERPCPDRPLADAEVQVVRGGDVVATVRSDDDGRFTVGLDPGHYVVQAVVEPGGPGMSAKPVDVTVTRGEFTDVSVPVDTGIR